MRGIAQTNQRGATDMRQAMRKNPTRNWLWRCALIALAMTLAGCGQLETPVMQPPTDAPVMEAGEQPATIMPTDAPTDTPIPPTATATDTPPTATPIPTATPEPTAAPQSPIDRLVAVRNPGKWRRPLPDLPGCRQLFMRKLPQPKQREEAHRSGLAEYQRSGGDARRRAKRRRVHLSVHHRYQFLYRRGLRSRTDAAKTGLRSTATWRFSTLSPT